jgi:hypothetical protein
VAAAAALVSASASATAAAVVGHGVGWLADRQWSAYSSGISSNGISGSSSSINNNSNSGSGTWGRVGSKTGNEVHTAASAAGHRQVGIGDVSVSYNLMHIFILFIIITIYKMYAMVEFIHMMNGAKKAPQKMRKWWRNEESIELIALFGSGSGSFWPPITKTIILYFFQKYIIVLMP